MLGWRLPQAGAPPFAVHCPIPQVILDSIVCWFGSLQLVWFLPHFASAYACSSVRLFCTLPAFTFDSHLVGWLRSLPARSAVDLRYVDLFTVDYRVVPGWIGSGLVLVVLLVVSGLFWFVVRYHHLLVPLYT